MMQMSKREKLLEKIRRGDSDYCIRFDDLRTLLIGLGFSEGISGSHHVFKKPLRLCVNFSPPCLIPVIRGQIQFGL